jgi:hypothetical protein
MRMNIASPFTLREWLFFYNRLILRDLDRGDTDALTRHVAKRNEIMDLLRLRDDDEIEVAA